MATGPRCDGSRGPRRLSRPASARVPVEPDVADDRVAQRPAGGPVGADREPDAGRDPPDAPASGRGQLALADGEAESLAALGVEAELDRAGERGLAVGAGAGEI